MICFFTKLLGIGSGLDLNVFYICFLTLPFASNSYSYESIFCNLHAYLKGVKESACWEATQFVFPSVLSCIDDCYYCSNIIVSLFSSFVRSLAYDCKKDQKLVHAVQKQIFSA